MLKTRLRKCAELAGNGASLARETGIPRRTLETYLSGTAEPKASRLADIARVAGVSGHWLLTGEGTSIPDESECVSEFELLHKPALGTPDLDTAVRGWGFQGNRLSFKQEWIDRQGWDAQALRLLEAHGDSMASTIHDGALLLVDIRCRALQEEGVYVIETEGFLLLRRIQFDVSGGVFATNDNPAYREQYLHREKREALEVFGKVVWVGNRLD